MIPRVAIAALALGTIICVLSLCGCSSGTIPPTPAPESNATPAPSIHPGSPISGYVYIEGVPVENAQVEAVSADGAYVVQNTTNGSGAYVLFLPEGVHFGAHSGAYSGGQFNLTATYSWMRHTVWPVFGKGRYDVYLNTTPKTIITGKGRVVGGPLGYNASLFNFSAVAIQAVPADGNATVPTVSTTASSDGNYTLEVRPGVRYYLKGGLLTNMWFNYHNTERGGLSIEIGMGPDETALIDYTVVLPST